MEIWKLLVLFLCAFGGGMVILFIKSNTHSPLKLILSFSGAFLFGITALHLLPEVYNSSQAGQAGLFVILGFLFQLLVEQFSEGVEHGHIHTHHEGKIFPYGIMISLCLHAFLEGMPLAKDAHNQLIFGIALHHIPASFALASIIMQNQLGVRTLVLSLIIFAAMAPAGYFFSQQLSSGGIVNGIQAYFNNIMAFVIGIFLHISTTILFETGTNHKVNVKKLIAIILGFSIAIGSYYSEGTSHNHNEHAPAETHAH